MEAINDLARRFVTLAGVVAVCALILLLLIVFSSPDRAVAWGLAMIFGVAIMSFAQPPVISYKSALPKNYQGLTGSIFGCQ